MNLVLENSLSSPTDNNPPADERKQSPPAFLDLADSVRHLFLRNLLAVVANHIPWQAARLGSNLPDMSAVSTASVGE